jgi:hypothetical protein
MHVSRLKCLANNYVAFVRELTMPTDLPPLVGEVIDKFCR